MQIVILNVESLYKNSFHLIQTQAFVIGQIHFAIIRDADAKMSHPVSTMSGPHFDRITYRKGSSLLQMLNYTLGESVLQQGFRLYLQQRQYDSATHEQLWAALTTVLSNSIID